MTFIVELTSGRGHTYVADPAEVAAAWMLPEVALVSSDDVACGRAIIGARAPAASGPTRRLPPSCRRGRRSGRTALDDPVPRRAFGAAGLGLGFAATEPILRSCDEGGVTCYLVSTNTRNVPMHERPGFHVTGEVRDPDVTVTLRSMRRPPAGWAPVAAVSPCAEADGGPRRPRPR